MNSHQAAWRVVFWASVLGSTVAYAEDNPESKPTITFGGFIRGDYGSGDRYPDARGEDQLGVSKAAFAVTAQHRDLKGVFVVGTERLTDGGASNDGDVDIKDAFIVIGADKETGFIWSIGAQALLFGLKPNGYPGDRSLQPSIEFGGAGAFAVSNQAGPSIIGNYRFSPDFSLRFGAFDLDADNTTNLPPDDGSKLTDNLFVQLRADHLFNTGLYATVGAESLYVGGATNDSKPIAAAGVGYTQGMIDASVELTRLDETILGTVDDEQYLVTELTFNPNTQWQVYTDWAQARELDADTLRIGTHYKYTEHLIFSGEYSKDQLDFTGASDVDSVDFRVEVVY
jgi:hypothetical protein